MINSLNNSTHQASALQLKPHVVNLISWRKQFIFLLYQKLVKILLFGPDLLYPQVDEKQFYSLLISPAMYCCYKGEMI